MDKVKEYMDRCTAHFDSIPKVKLVADKVGVPSGYVAVAILILALFLVFSDIGSKVICDVIGVFYPAYISFKAIESPGADDDKQWLTYWVVFAAVRGCETVFDYLLFWLPFYFLGKLVFLIWLAFPETRGALLIYNRLLRPLLKHHEQEIDSALSDARSATSEVSKQASSAAKQVASDHAGDIMNAGASLMADKKSD